METVQDKPKRNLLIVAASIIILFLLGLVFWWLLSGRNQASDSNDQNRVASKSASTSSSNKASTQSSTATPEVKTYLVKVFFSKHPESDNDPTKVFPLNRVSPDLGVAKYGLKQLIAGPTAEETAASYFTQVKLSGESTCAGEDFTLNILNSIATLKFCRQFTSLGVVSDGQAKSEIEATLRQFSSISKVVVLSQDEHCLFDQSGQDLCKT